ncbi:MAG TPA: histidine kinase [Cytophagales bacterium]|nr:histidine kinase [Cytophagales bacterium]HAA21496.1 histidine kinase [Cytophagales bacterium]HAP64629.1 histidine kinase [Cytophagales bacterium]
MEKRRSISIGRKILGGFGLLVVAFIIYAGVSIFVLQESKRIINENSRVIRPSTDAINEFVLMVTQSKMYITNWVYLPMTDELESDKDILKMLLDYNYPELETRLDDLKEKWEDPEQQQMLDSAKAQFEALKVSMSEIMQTLVTFEDYEDPMTAFMAEDLVTSQILGPSQELITMLEQLAEMKRLEMQAADTNLKEQFGNLERTAYMLGAFIILAGILSGVFLSRSITKPINYLKQVIEKLGLGELPEDKNQKFSRDEIGDMGVAVQTLTEGLRSTSFFAEKIGKGEYDAEFTPLSDNDVLGNSLLEMRSNLKSVAEDDRQRNWANEGIAKFGEILRKNNDNLEILADEVISSLVKYVEGNQGGLYIVNEADEFEGEDEEYMTLSSCYAWEKKKYLEQKVYKGDGLTGQAWMEQDTIYMTDVPQDYMMITSGLGKATPGYILIVPMKINEEVFGVLELASFYEFPDYRIRFVERVAESIASTLSSVKISAKTQRLLEESTELTEQMRAQEEEMRQNMEELQATQEEMQRSQREREEKEKIINNTNMMMELDAELNILNTNEVLTEVLGYEIAEIRGKALESFVASKNEFQKAMDLMEVGRTYSGVFKMMNSKNQTVLVKISAGKSYDPMMSEDKYLFFGSDLTNLTAEA